MSNTEATFIDENGQVRLAGQIGAPNAAVDQVLTADGAGNTSFEDAGGALPNPITTAVAIEPATAGSQALLVQNTPDGSYALAQFVSQATGAGATVIDAHGGMSVEPGSGSTAAAIACANDNAAQNAFEAWDTGFNNLAVAITGPGYLKVAKNTAPADAALAAGECAVWFDPSNGAAKFMFKGKSADGTVVAGSVALT